MLGQTLHLQSGRVVTRQSHKKIDLENLYGAEYSLYSTDLLNALEYYENETYLTSLVYDYRTKTLMAHCRYFAKQVYPCSVELMAINNQSGGDEGIQKLTLYLIDEPSEVMRSTYQHSLQFYSPTFIELGYKFQYNKALYRVTQRHIQWGRAFYLAEAGQ